MAHRRIPGSTVSRALRSSLFALFTLVNFSAVSFGADVVSACLDKKSASGTFAISRVPRQASSADAFGWSRTLTGRTRLPDFSGLMAFAPGGGMSGGGIEGISNAAGIRARETPMQFRA